ncbi:MAG: MerR family transcriptional regulator [Endozoicomonas sp.]
MKLFRIGEISKLYGISVDTLRHYEKLGILKPEQISDSGYRYYSNRQIWKLNIIRTLRQLDVGLPEIREFMVNRTLAKSQQLIEFQLQTITEKQKELAALKQELEARRSYLKAAQVNETGVIERRVLPVRKAWTLEQEVSLVWDVDRIHKEIETKLTGRQLSYFAWGRAGAVISETDFHDANYLRYSSSFILDQEGSAEIAGGDYLCLHFHGQYSSELMEEHYARIKEYMISHTLEVSGSVIEIYKLDIHETDQEQEFLTEIQVPVSSR